MDKQNIDLRELSDDELIKKVSFIIFLFKKQMKNISRLMIGMTMKLFKVIYRHGRKAFLILMEK